MVILNSPSGCQLIPAGDELLREIHRMGRANFAIFALC